MKCLHAQTRCSVFASTTTRPSSCSCLQPKTLEQRFQTRRGSHHVGHDDWWRHLPDSSGKQWKPHVPLSNSHFPITPARVWDTQSDQQHRGPSSDRFVDRRNWRPTITSTSKVLEVPSLRGLLPFVRAVFLKPSKHKWVEKGSDTDICQLKRRASDAFALQFGNSQCFR